MSFTDGVRVIPPQAPWINVDLQVEEDDLDEAFRPFGDLTSLHLPFDRTEACW